MICGCGRVRKEWFEYVEDLFLLRKGVRRERCLVGWVLMSGMSRDEEE